MVEGVAETGPEFQQADYSGPSGKGNDMSREGNEVYLLGGTVNSRVSRIVTTYTGSRGERKLGGQAGARLWTPLFAKIQRKLDIST